jgi:hypothetical protein
MTYRNSVSVAFDAPGSFSMGQINCAGIAEDVSIILDELQ